MNETKESREQLLERIEYGKQFEKYRDSDHVEYDFEHIYSEIERYVLASAVERIRALHLEWHGGLPEESLALLVKIYDELLPAKPEGGSKSAGVEFAPEEIDEEELEKAYWHFDTLMSTRVKRMEISDRDAFKQTVRGYLIAALEAERGKK
jgi:hypothetical protein